MVAAEFLSDSAARVRVDKWLWAARFFKTRSLAAQAVEGGKVRVNGERVKAAKPVRTGDRLAIHDGISERTISVRALSERRGPAQAARTLYAEDESSLEQRAAAVAKQRELLRLGLGYAGRPEKKQRRALRRLRGY